MSAFIEDGWTVEGVVRGRRDLFPAFQAVYRPVLPERLYRYQKADRSTPGKELALDAELIVEHVLAWELPVPKASPPHPSDGSVGEGRTVPTAERCKRLHPLALAQLLNLITGHSAEILEYVPNSGTAC